MLSGWFKPSLGTGQFERQGYRSVTMKGKRKNGRED